MTDPLGQSQVLPYLMELSKKEFQFHLISFEKHDRLVAHKSHIQSICDSSNIIWYPQDYHSEGGLFRTLKQIRRMKKVALELHRTHHFDIVHCRSYISSLVGLYLKRKFGVKFLFDMRGFWADERVDGKLWNLNNPVYKLIYNFFKKKEKNYLIDADYTVVLTQAGKSEIESWKSIKGNQLQIEVIPCCVDLRLFDPTKVDEDTKNEVRTALNIQSNEFILGYVGSIGTWYMLDEMLEYFVELKEINQNARFLFVTGESNDFIRAKASEKSIAHQDIIITSCLHSQMPRYISIFNQSIFFIRPSFSKKASSPTKQGEIMAMGVPIICNSGIGDTDLIVEKYRAGKSISNFDKINYQNALSIDDFKQSETIKGAVEYFSLESGASKYESIYRSILEK